MSYTPEDVLASVVKAADDRLAENIMALDVRGISILADYFVITNGGSARQNRAITHAVIDEAEKEGIQVQKVEGRDSETWTLIDLGDVIVHVFSEDDRAFYNLEKLWSDASLVDISPYINDEAQ